MSLFEELSQSFPCEVVEPFGEVIVVPLKVFREEWKPKLESEGVQTYTNAYRGQVCVFLRKKMQNQTVPEASKFEKPKNVWTREEEELFLKLYDEGVGFNEICKRLGKTRMQIMGKISNLKKQQKMKVGDLNPQPVKVEAKANPSFKELLEACLALYPMHSKACLILLDKAKEMLP